MQIRCVIQNTNSLSFPNLQIKKLRQVIFWDNNKEGLTIYTALLVGGNGNANDLTDNIVSQLSEGFKLVVTFEVTDNEVEIDNVDSECLNKDFFKEIDKVRSSQLWGEGCREITRQGELSQILKKILVQDTIEDSKIQISDDKYLLVAENTEDYKIVACEGEVRKLNDGNIGYSITSRKDLHRGVDCITWVRTSISFKGKLSTKEKICLSLELSSEGNSRHSLSYISMYFCPPEGYHISDDSEVNLLMKGGQGTEDKKNNLMTVTHNETLYYKDWIDKHHIDRRSLYRLNKEKLFSNIKAPYECEAISVSFTCVPNTEKGSTQFVLGAILSAAITFGVDSGRLGEVKNCFWPVVPADIQWYTLCFIMFYAFLRWCSRREKIKRNVWDSVANILFVGGMLLEGVWGIVTYVVWRLDIEKLKNFLNTIPIYTVPMIFLAGAVLLFLFLAISFIFIKDHYFRRPLSKDLVI